MTEWLKVERAKWEVESLRFLTLAPSGVDRWFALLKMTSSRFGHAVYKGGDAGVAEACGLHLSSLFHFSLLL